MRRIVIDTNCLIACIGRHSAFRQVWDAYINGEFALCVSNEILTEYEEVMSLKTSKEIAKDIAEIIVNRQNTVFINPTYRFEIIVTDPDDNKFVDCAIVSNAEYLVSNDRHFNILKSISFPKVSVIKIDEFSEQLKPL